MTKPRIWKKLPSRGDDPELLKRESEMPENLDDPFTRRNPSLRGKDLTGLQIRLLGLLYDSDPPQPGVLAAIAEIIANQEKIIANQEKILSNQEKLVAR
jgi:hypothetical protein